MQLIKFSMQSAERNDLEFELYSDRRNCLPPRYCKLQITQEKY